MGRRETGKKDARLTQGRITILLGVGGLRKLGRVDAESALTVLPGM